jgi:Flp pilus assembly protein TadG
MRAPRTKSTTNRQRFRGQGLVEFALVFPLFMLILGGLAEGARLAYSYNAVNHSAQEAGRVASIRETTSMDTVRAKAVDAAQPLSVSGSNVTVAVNGGGKGFADKEIGDRVEVSVKYQFVPIISMVFGSKTGIQLTGSTELMVE